MMPADHNKPAWVQLYEARQTSVEVETRSPGRPPSPIPRHKVGVTLSQGEVQELQVWQERLSRLLRRKVSVGETIGILTRICTARQNRLPAEPQPENLTALVERMIEQG
ncbi:MAG: hypothetical protein HPY76_10215 [Anaerolineae bacterium]|jgi:hypothetical protein|nr:hypothetical protein [Anaerolineae bacterium]